MRRVLLLCVLAGGALLAAAPPATAASSCQQAVAQMKENIAALVPATGPPVKDSPAATKLKEQSYTKFQAAIAKHPDCQSEFAQFGQQLLGSHKATPHGTAFLGPIGWLWNEIYYSIFQGSTVLMVMFGWELFLSPFILVFCMLAVFRGTAGLLKKPYVPPELRTNEQ
jgi:hypothetical protein